jgi:dTDP-4-dehydrorhamnose 3,5-epimerase-like enzyme
MCYLVSNFFSAQHPRRIRYHAMRLYIEWPIPIRVVSNQDVSWTLIKTGKGDWKPSYCDCVSR